MSNERERATQQPGFHWLGFTARIPILHTRVCWPEFFQGILVAAATALALVPLLTHYFGLSFEEAIAMSFLHSFLISASCIVLLSHWSVSLL